MSPAQGLGATGSRSGAVRPKWRLGCGRSSAAVALVATVTLALAACGSSSKGAAGSSGAGSTTTTAAAGGTTVPATIPPGTTLRVGDQLEFLQTILHTTGEDTGLPYKLQWAGFIGGPPMLQAFHANAIDAGFVAGTPLIFAQAASQDVVGVAGWATTNGTAELIAAPNSGINGWADLKGKKVAFQKGTSAEGTVLTGLKGAGLSLHDITAVDLPITQISAALQGGSAQAGVLVAPLDTAYLTSNKGSKVVDRPKDLAGRVSFLVARQSAIDNPAKAAALQDYIDRFVKALAKIKADPDGFVKNFYVAKYGLTLAAGKALLAQTGSTSFIALSGDLISAQQTLADLYHDAGEIPDKVDASKEFDNRFASAAVTGATG